MAFAGFTETSGSPFVFSSPPFGYINVRSSQYGAQGNGVADDTVPINNAIAAANVLAAGNMPVGVYFPPGVYLITAALTTPGTSVGLLGSGTYMTTILTSLATGTVLTLSNNGSSVVGLSFQENNALNSATALQVAAVNVALRDLTVSSWSNGITFTSAAQFARLMKVFVASSIASSLGISLAGSDHELTDLVLSGNAIMAGISGAAFSDVGLANVVFKNCLTGMSLVPGNAQTVEGPSLSGCNFDGCATAINLAPTGTGVIQHLNVSGGEINNPAASAQGIVFNGPANSILGCLFTGVPFALGGAGATAVVPTGGTSAANPVSFENCNFFGATATFSGTVLTTGNNTILVRNCPGVNPLGKAITTPAIGSTGVFTPNPFGFSVDVLFTTIATTSGVNIKDTAGNTQLVISNPAAGSVIPLIRLEPGEQIDWAQAGTPSWVWLGRS
jgi:hypothetical protein